jgi:hypothetical protein
VWFIFTKLFFKFFGIVYAEYSVQGLLIVHVYLPVPQSVKTKESKVISVSLWTSDLLGYWITYSRRELSW